MWSTHISGILSPPDLPSWEFYKYFTVINESKIGFPPPLLLNHFSSPSSTQVSAPSHHLPNPTAGQSWWENGFPEGFEFQTGSNSFSPLPSAVFHLPLIQLSAEQRVIAFDERSRFFLATSDSNVTGFTTRTSSYENGQILCPMWTFGLSIWTDLGERLQVHSGLGYRWQGFLEKFCSGVKKQKHHKLIRMERPVQLSHKVDMFSLWEDLNSSWRMLVMSTEVMNETGEVWMRNRGC